MADNTYRNMVKGTAIFGGMQVFTILINLIRGKFVALLLGPEGMGISSLLTSSMNTIQQCTSLGLNLSIVKEISEAREANDKERISQVAFLSRILLKCTALIGAIITFIFSKSLSVLSFGNTHYKWYFILLSAVVFLTTLSNGELALLQGLREIKKLAYASIIGASTGLFIGIPLYYFLGYEGIVPAMIALSLATYGFYKYSGRKLWNKKIRGERERNQLFPLAKKMVYLGVVLMVASLLGTGANYALNTFISHYGTLDDVGLYQATNSVTNQYVGVVFTAMSLDYLPRLAAIQNDSVKLSDVVNKQIEIVMFILAPLSALLILFAPLVVRLFLSEKFLTIIPLLRWMAVGLFLKGLAYPMGYISFSKGDKKTFFWLEGIWANLSMLFISLLSYHVWGLIGLGISVCMIYFIGCALYLLITFRRYHYQPERSLYRVVGFLMFFLSICFCGSLLSNLIYGYIVMSISSLVCVLYCLVQLNRRLGIMKKYINTSKL